VTRIIWSPQSVRDLQSIREYIAADSPVYAELVVGRLVKSVERLQAFPESGRIVPERNSAEIREVIVAPYRVIYRFREGNVEVITVFRSSRLLPNLPEAQ
jgi:addiction module RelE/StbE family toxin